MNERLENFMSGLIRFFLFVGLFMVVLFSAFFSDKTVIPVLFPSYICMILSIVFTIVVVSLFVRSKIDRNLWLNKRMNLLLAFILLFAFQAFLCINISFKTSWDSQAVQYSAFFAATKDEAGMKDMASYLSIYPSNLLLVWIYSLFFYWNECVFRVTGNTLNLLQLFQCAISSFAGIMTYKCAYKLTKNYLMARFSFYLYILITGISGWLVVPYSDSTGLFLPITLFFLIISFFDEDNKVKRYRLIVAIGFLSYVSYRIKPEIDIVVVAFIVILLVTEIRKLLNIKMAISFAAGFALSVLLVGFAINSMGYELNPEAEFGWQHYIMQSVNVASDGGNSDLDLAFSQSFTTKAERNVANLSIARKRVHEMGFVGFLRLMGVKIYRAFCSGTFGFGGLGKSFYHEIYEPRLGNISVVLRKFFWEKEAFDDGVSYYDYYALIKQILWDAVIVTILVSVFYFKRFNSKEMVLYLSIVGIFPYFMLLESHPRYMLVQTPLLVLAAVLGLKKIKEIKQ